MGKTINGTFALHGDVESFGELALKGRNSSLKLSSRFELPLGRETPSLHGVTLDGRKITCVDCIISSMKKARRGKVDVHHNAILFPHFVILGDEHLEPRERSITSISFTVTDVSTLFYDFDAFGFCVDAASAIGPVLEVQSRIRPVHAGSAPSIAYFTGRFEVASVSSPIGMVRVCHRPTSNMGGPDGFFMKNQIYISIEPESPLSFEEAVERVACLYRFFSLLAGRDQGVKDIKIKTTRDSNEQPGLPMEVYWCYAPKGSRVSDSHYKPHPRDVPLDPVERPEEFSQVLCDWLARDAGWRIARSRSLSCLKKGNSYGVDRLVAAANMFDVLPPEALPLLDPLPDELFKAQTAFLDTFRRLPQSPDRDSAISAIARMGKLSLPKKVTHRLKIVEGHLGRRVPELATVLRLAVKCRNHFVHGGSEDFNFTPIEPFVGFLTDALEFVFSASDLIEAGWDASRWSSDAHGTGHSFARFLWGYNETLVHLKRAVGATQ